MVGVDKSSPYRATLMKLIAAIDKYSVTLQPKDQVLIVMSLDTEDKIIEFIQWVKSKLSGENNLNATETEIVRAAVRIGKQLPPTK